MNSSNRLLSSIAFLCTMSGQAAFAASSDTYYPVEVTLDGPSRCGNVAQRPWCNTSLTPDQRADLLLQAMTLEQKIGLMAGDNIFSAVKGNPATGVVDGIESLGIPTQYYSDGPVGPREGKATQMPSGMSLGSSFDPSLARKVSAVVADEVKKKGNDFVHGPVADVVRLPQAGRTFETYGEDPLLNGAMSTAWIKGVQSQGIIATLKHYTVNTQEGLVAIPLVYTAFISSRNKVNANVDERTLREIYLRSFEIATKDGDPGVVLCAYTYVNGDPACSNEHLIQTVLKKTWGFEGFTIADYVYAMKNTVQTANVGCDVEMSAPIYYAPYRLMAAIASGQVTVEKIDEHLHAVLRTLFRYHFFDRANFPSNDALIDQAAHATVAQESSEQGTVLLKNNKGLLPLSNTPGSILVIGAATENVRGGGSSQVTPFSFVSPLDGIKARASGSTVQYDDGTDAARAASAASSASVVILFASKVATEGTDATCLDLDCPGNLPSGIVDKVQDKLIEAVAAANPKTIVVLQTAAPVIMPWKDKVPAILETWFPGQNAGTAVARVLFGDTDPGGRLPISFPENNSDTAVAGDKKQYPGVQNQTDFTEGVFTGYRWHDSRNVVPAFPFGFGLSYTRFQLSNLTLSVQGTEIKATATVKNTGARAGWTVPQLYAAMPSPSASVKQPPHWLKGFDKQWLNPGESGDLQFSMNEQDLSYWDVAANDWRVADGCYSIDLGFSSRDLPLKTALRRQSGQWVIGSCS